MFERIIDSQLFGNGGSQQLAITAYESQRVVYGKQKSILMKCDSKLHGIVRFQRMLLGQPGCVKEVLAFDSGQVVATKDVIGKVIKSGISHTPPKTTVSIDHSKGSSHFSDADVCD